MRQKEKTISSEFRLTGFLLKTVSYIMFLAQKLPPYFSKTKPIITLQIDLYDEAKVVSILFPLIIIDLLELSQRLSQSITVFKFTLENEFF